MSQLVKGGPKSQSVTLATSGDTFSKSAPLLLLFLSALIGLVPSTNRKFHTLDDATFTCSFLREQKDNLTTTGETRDHRSRSLYRNKARRQRRSRKKRSELTQFRCYLAFHSPPIYSTHAPQDIRQRAPFWAALTIPMNPKRHTVRIRNTFKYVARSGRSNA